MAIVPKAVYETQTDAADPGYPHGKAVNETGNDYNGTPLEAAWLNDLWGFQQALLGAAGVVPSGTPDKVGASDYLAALNALIAQRVTGTRVISAAAHLVRRDFDPPLWSIDNSYKVLLKGASFGYYVDVSSFLSPGVRITGVGAKVQPGAARTESERMYVELVRRDAGNTLQLVSTFGNRGFDDGTTTLQSISVISVSHVVDLAGWSYFVRVTSGGDADTANDTLLSASITLA